MVDMGGFGLLGPLLAIPLPRSALAHTIPTKIGVFLNSSKPAAMANSATLPSPTSVQRSTNDASVSLTGVGHGDERREAVCRGKPHGCVCLLCFLREADG
jgi:hypothetical protein